MTKTHIKNTIVSLTILIVISNSAYGSINNNFFIQKKQTNLVENILEKTSVSIASEELTFGQIDISLIKTVEINDILSIQLPNIIGETQLEIKKIDHNIKNIVTYSGIVSGVEASSFLISLEENKILANIKINHQTYIIEPADTNADTHILHKINHSWLPQDNEDYVFLTDSDEKKPIRKPHSNPQSSKSTNNIRVLFLYANDVNNADMRASQVITEFNNALNRSLVNPLNRLVSAGTAQLINDDFSSKSRLNIINDMASRKNVFTDIDIRMQSVEADIVLLFIKADISSNKVGGIAINYEQNNPFALTTDTYALTDLTAVHEIGHVLGGNHAVGSPDNGANPIDDRAHGVSGDNGNWQTIMGGYDFNCTFDFALGGAAQPCKRLNYFSNPAITPPPITQGQPIGNVKTADMESVLETTMPIVSGWGQSQSPNYQAPVRGYSYDPIKNGHGIHISRTDMGKYVLIFYSYDTIGRPEWFYTEASFQNNQLSGSLYRTKPNNKGEIDYISAGTFSLNYAISAVNNATQCNGVNRSSQPGVFNWSIDGQSGQWCMQPLFIDDITNKPHQPSGKSGLWYTPSSNGSGFTMQLKPTGFTSNLTFTTVYYYDNSGIGRWAAGQVINPIPDHITINSYMHTNGYPRNSTGSLSSQDIGSFQMNYDNDRASINLSYPLAPGGNWNINNEQVYQLNN